MAKVIFTISYDVQPEKRDQYLELTQVMKQHLPGTNGREYAIYEQKGKKNSFSEVFVFTSMQEFDSLEDQDERTGELIQKLETLLVDGKMRYSTLIELE
jgi:antibiotic biosynthesis monooxygenase (ABM) superfamily enzyme